MSILIIKDNITNCKTALWPHCRLWLWISPPKLQQRQWGNKKKMDKRKMVTAPQSRLCVFPAVSHVCGMVVLKMSSMQLQILSQVSGENFSPFRMTTFSRQLVPERASCSLSTDQQVEKRRERGALERGSERPYRDILQIPTSCDYTKTIKNTEIVTSHLAAHTSRAEPEYRPAEHHRETQSTGWRRHRWHKVHGYRWWSSTLLSVKEGFNRRWRQSEWLKVLKRFFLKGYSLLLQSVARAASCCRRSWRRFWTNPATSASQRCGRRFSSLQTSLLDPWDEHMNTFFFSNIWSKPKAFELWPHGDLLLPSPDVQLTPVDDAGELKENGEPSSHPHAVLRSHVDVITGVVFERLAHKKRNNYIIRIYTVHTVYTVYIYMYKTQMFLHKYWWWYKYMF